MTYNSSNYQLTNPGGFGKKALVVGVVGLVLSALGFFVDPARFYHAWLVAFVFWVSLGLGALFFTMLHHLVGAQWSVVVRRIAESLMAALPYMAAFFIPVLLGMHTLYHWTHEDVVAADKLLTGKSGYLNTGFFLARTILFFVIWTLLARTLYRLSLEQDKSPSEELTIRMRRVSAVGMILFAFTTTYAGYDWLMSLDPHWYSTIFGVYYFAGGLLGVLALMTFISLFLRSNNVLKETITVEHYHDLGKLTFAFIIFWTYIGFSQYFLIWYGNIPEETVWYLARWEGSWKFVSLVILFGHFALPFTLMTFRAGKRNYTFLKFMTAWLLLMHWVDMYWLVYPTLLEHGATFHWLDPVTMMAVGGMFLWFFWSRFSKHPLIPINDPKLEGSLHHVNPF